MSAQHQNKLGRGTPTSTMRGAVRRFLLRFVEIPSAEYFPRRHRQKILAAIKKALQESRSHASKPGSSVSPLATEPAGEVSSPRFTTEQLVDIAKIINPLAAH